MDSVGTMERVVGEITRLVGGVSDAQLGDKTPCAEWTVKDLLAHLVGGADLFSDIFEDKQPNLAPPELPDDAGAIAETWAANSDRVLRAFRADGALERTATFPWGDMPGIAAVNLAVFDVTTHAADLATATGQAPPPDDLLVQALEVGRQMIAPEMRAPGLFDAEQVAPENASAAQRLLAFAGRTV